MSDGFKIFWVEIISTGDGRARRVDRDYARYLVSHGLARYANHPESTMMETPENAMMPRARGKIYDGNRGAGR